MPVTKGLTIPLITLQQCECTIIFDLDPFIHITMTTQLPGSFIASQETNHTVRSVVTLFDQFNYQYILRAPDTETASRRAAI